MQQIKIENIIKVSSNKIYAGAHWRERSKLKESYLWLTKSPFKKLKPVNGKVDLDFQFFFASRPLDSSNLGYMAKMIEDCLVTYGILQDDSIKYVGQISLESFKSKEKDQDYCILTLNEKTIL
jgi:hypothetical protein